MIEYPTYMQTIHSTWLTAVASAITTAAGTNPFASTTGYDPATDITAMATAISNFQTIVTAMDAHTNFDTYHDAAIAQIDAKIAPDAYILARVVAHANALDTEVTSKILPRFNAGMRDINAVQSSTFTLGRAIIELDRNDKVDKFMADMRFQADAKRGDLVQAATAEMIRMFLQKTEYGRVIAATTIEELRLKIAANQDYKTENKSIEADEGRWPLEMYKYGGNMLAAIGGGTTSSVPVDGSKTARIIGSGLSGAVVGAQIGAAVGGGNAGIGAILGGIAGLAAGS